MKQFFTLLFLILVISGLPLTKISGQSFIEFSKLGGGDNFDYGSYIQVVNGETYSINTYYNGSAFGNKIIKYGLAGSIIYSTDFGVGNYYGFYSIKVINGEVYLLGTGSYNKILVIKLHTDGSVDFIKLIGGNSEIVGLSTEIQIVGNEMFIAGTILGNDFPVTMGNIPPASNYLNGFLIKISTLDGTVIRSMYTPDIVSFNFLQIEGGAIFMASTSNNPNLPITIGGAPTTTASNVYIQKIRTSDFSIVYARYLGDAPVTYVTGYKVLNGEFHLTGSTTSPGFPVTNSTSLGTATSERDGFYTRLNADGSIGFSTYLTIPGYYDNPTYLKISNGNIFIMGDTRNINNSTDEAAFLYKLNSNGSVNYLRKFNIAHNVYFSIHQSFEIIGDDVYLAGGGVAPDFPVTDGSQYSGGERTGFVIHYDALGNIVFATFLSAVQNYFLPMKIDNGKIYLVYNTNDATYSSTDNTTLAGETDNLIVVLKTDGTRVFSRYLGGSDDDSPEDMAIDNGNIYLSGTTRSVDFPVTDNVLHQGWSDWHLTKISFCSSHYYTANDTLSPPTQTVCKYGLAEPIIGQPIVIPGDSLPTIYLNGTATFQQTMTGISYQWQVASVLTGPWNNIQGATLKDYRAVIGGINQYYRRLCFTPASCGTALIHTSDTSTVLVNSLTAPTVNAGGPFTTCPSSAITIGGAPTASGGNPPYTSYNWDMGAAAVTNPTVSPLNNTIYTLIVTDAAGCKQIAQAVVLVYKADAGPDKSNCAGTPVRIGANSIAGLPGVVYEWLPATNLSSVSISQPFANPPAQTDYTLTLTIPKSGGGTCVTHDAMTVSPIAAPATNNFAGPDIVMCLGDSVSLGTPPEPGFNYAWNPSTNLGNINLSTATYYIHNDDMPVPNPATINLMAHNNGCTFTDQLVVAVIEANAGGNGCGPKIIGKPDRTPNINETFSWIKVSGPGNFTGATNLPQVPVSASIGGITTYRLTVSYNGHSCYDEIIITDTCGNFECSAAIRVGARYECPGYDVNNGNVTLIASSSIPDAIFTWQPQQGLSVYTGSSVNLTDNIPRTYTVTATSISDTSFYATATISTNDPAYTAPLFSARDTVTCRDIPVTIGSPPAMGYTYTWSGGSLSNNFISNPIAYLSSPTYYYVTVANGTGCALKDTVLVLIQFVYANGGADWTICSNGVASLGSQPQSNATYFWEPQSAPWQNGTNQFSPQPQVLAATTVTYTLTVTTSAGCIATDTVKVTVSNSPTIPNAPDRVSCVGVGTPIGNPSLPGVTYQWTPATGLNDPTDAQPYAIPAVTTTYTVVATFPGTCGLPATDIVTVSVNDPSFSMPDINFCPGNGPIALGTNAPVGMNYYYWRPTSLVTNATIANPGTHDPPPNTITNFTLTIGNSFGCYYTDTIRLIPFTQAPVAGADQNICKGQPTIIGSASNPTGPSISYSWNPVNYLNDAASPNPVFTGTMAGTFQYILTKTDNSIPCTSTDTININVVDLLPGISSPTICRNTCVQIGTNPISGINYQWTPATGLSNAGIANPIACIDSTSMSYTLTASDQSGCTTSANVVVGVNVVSGLQVSVPDIIACVGDNVTFSPSVPVGSYSYLWSPDNGTLSNIYTANPSILTTTEGDFQYGLQITDNTTGCTNITTANVEIINCSPYASTGNLMWYDSNPNGIQDNGELGVSGMTVKLYNSIGFNIATTVTDAFGIYYFNNISPGNDYYIVFNKPAGYAFTLQYVGGINATDNSKTDANGRTANFNLITGNDISNLDAGIKSAGPVPVSLLSFTATLKNRVVLLNWQTTAEYNNHYFDVERSTDGINFIKIGKVQGNGTTPLPHNYSLTDQHPVIGINYYRLKQVDFDNNATYSNIVPVELKADTNVTAYYNNTDNTIRINFKEKQHDLRIKIFANNGQLIKSVTPTNNTTEYTIQLPVISNGIYVLQITNDKWNYSKKLFITK